MVPIFEHNDTHETTGSTQEAQVQRDETVLDATLQRSWDDLSDWEQTKFVVRILREMSGLSDARLRHTYNGDGTPYDTGLIDWKRIKVEEEARKLIKKKRGKKHETSVKGNVTGS
jgi:pheromone shutdown protein TraB